MESDSVGNHTNNHYKQVQTDIRWQANYQRSNYKCQNYMQDQSDLRNCSAHYCCSTISWWQKFWYISVAGMGGVRLYFSCMGMYRWIGYGLQKGSRILQSCFSYLVLTRQYQLPIIQWNSRWEGQRGGAFWYLGCTMVTKLIWMVPLCLAQTNITQKNICYYKLRIDLMKKQAIIFGNFDCDIQAAVSCISLKNDLQ